MVQHCFRPILFFTTLFYLFSAISPVFSASPGINLINQPGNINIVTDPSLKNWLFYAPPSPENISNISASNVVLRLHSHWENAVAPKMLGTPAQQQEIATRWCNSIKSFSTGKTVYVEPFNELEHERERLNLSLNEAIDRAQNFINYLQSCPDKNFTVISPGLDPHHHNFPATQAAFGNFDIISYHAYGPAKARQYSSLFPGKKFILTEVGVLANGDSGTPVYDDCKFIQFFCDQKITQTWQQDSNIIAYFMFTVEPDGGSWKFSNHQVARALKNDCTNVTCESAVCDLSTIHDFPPVIVTTNNLSPPISNAQNIENKHPDNIPNNIDISDNTYCEKTISIEETFTYIPLLSDIGQTIKRFINRVEQEVLSSEYLTNHSTRKAQIHWTKEFPVEINAPSEVKNTSFKSYDSDGVGAALKSTSYQSQIKIKEQRLSEAYRSLTEENKYHGTTIDEQVAWGCGSQCFSVNCQKPEGLTCRPVFLSEIHAFQQGFISQYSSTYTSKKNQTFTQLDDNCYQKIFEALKIVDTGSYDTKHIILNDNTDNPNSTQKQAIPLAAVYPNNNAVNNLLPDTQELLESNICNTLAQDSARDRPNPLQFGKIVKNVDKIWDIFVEEVRTGLVFSRSERADLTKRIYFDTQYAQGVQKDDTALSYFIPEDTGKYIKDQPFSSTTNKNDTVHLGNRNEKLRDAFTSYLYPESWHEKLGTIDSFQRPDLPGDYEFIPGTVAENVQQWCPLIRKYSLENNLDPALIAALITVESGGKPDAISFQGAVGLMQIMPKDNTKTNQFDHFFTDRPTTAQLLHPEFNIKYGTSLLAGLISRWGSIELGVYRYGPAYHPTYYKTVLGIQASNPTACHNN